MKILLLLVVTAVLRKESLAQGVPSEGYNLPDEEIIPVVTPSLVQPRTSTGLPQTTNNQSSPLPVPQEKQCPEICTFEYLPVCGSNGVTYSNECSFNQAACNDPTLTLLHVGACVTTLEPLPPIPTQGGGEGGGSPCKRICIRIFAPVCGTDGKIYSNECVLNSFSCMAQEKGGAAIRSTSTLSACESQLLDHPDVDSIVEGSVASDVGSSGPSVDAVVEVPVDIVDSTPIVPSSSCPTLCPKIFTPVCGSDGVTHSNPCVLQYANCRSVEAGGSGVSLVQNAPCGGTESGPVAAGEPVDSAGSIGQTPVVNAPVGTVESPPVVGGSSCKPECTKIYIPVCGSDGVTYNNMCLLEYADCTSREAGGSGVIRVQNIPCGQSPIEEAAPITPQVNPSAKTSPCPNNCTRILAPVCGSDGVTYSNICLLEVRDCLDQEAGGSGVQVVSASSCGTPVTPAPVTLTPVTPAPVTLTPVTPAPVTPAPVTPAPSSSCNKGCPKILRPVCGSDGNTHDNECLMNVASCERRRSGGRHIYIVTMGPCDPKAEEKKKRDIIKASSCRHNCKEIYDPVCGNDGMTYDNECLLDMANCRKWEAKEPGVYIVDDGICGQPEAREIDSVRPAAQQISIQSVSTPVQSLPAPVQSLPAPVQSLPAPVQSLPAPVQSLPAPVQSLPAPVQSLPAPVQSPLLTSLGVSTRSSSTSSSCSEICTLEYDPICGSDNLTYNSQCHLKSANCRKRSLGGVGVTMAFQGPCVAALPQGPVCNQLCDKSLKYVCGSDGETYNNPCLLAHADCLNPFAPITIASEGRCGSPVALSDTSNSTEEESSLDDEEERLEAPQGDYLPPL